MFGQNTNVSPQMTLYIRLEKGTKSGYAATAIVFFVAPTKRPIKTLRDINKVNGERVTFALTFKSFMLLEGCEPW